MGLGPAVVVAMVPGLLARPGMVVPGMMVMEMVVPGVTVEVVMAPRLLVRPGQLPRPSR